MSLRRHAPTTLLLALLLALAAAASVLASPAVADIPDDDPVPPPGPAYATLLFSRTHVGLADGRCRRDDRGVVPIGRIAAYLQSKGLTATGSLETGATAENQVTCGTSGETLRSSWSTARWLADTYGWSFVSHTDTYPQDLAALPEEQAWAETCGSAVKIEAHGLPGARGMIAYPGAQSSPDQIQEHWGSQCFAWARTYDRSGTTTGAAGPHFWQSTQAPNGGACSLPAADCTRVPTRRKQHTYTHPGQVLRDVRALQPGQWLTVQAYVLVTGKSPDDTASGARWDCTGWDPRTHWTNDNERYCWSDWKRIVDALAERDDVVVTDPLTVGVAFGRPATYPSSD